MASEDIQKTAIVIPFGMFKFLRMPFGLRIARNTFQCMMDLVLGELPFCFVYMDDILIFCKDLSFQVDNLRESSVSAGSMVSPLASPSVNFLS